MSEMRLKFKPKSVSCSKPNAFFHQKTKSKMAKQFKYKSQLLIYW